MKKDEKYLAVFSDIEMDTMNGIELGKWLNKKHAQEKGGSNSPHFYYIT